MIVAKVFDLWKLLDDVTELKFAEDAEGLMFWAFPSLPVVLKWASSSLNIMRSSSKSSLNTIIRGLCLSLCSIKSISTGVGALSLYQSKSYYSFRKSSSNMKDSVTLSHISWVRVIPLLSVSVIYGSSASLRFLFFFPCLLTFYSSYSKLPFSHSRY